MTVRSLPAVGALLVAVALAAGCGSGDADQPTAAPSGPSVSAPAASGSPSATPPAIPPTAGGAASPPASPPAPATPAPPAEAQGPTQRRRATPPPVVLPQRPAGAPGAKQVVDAFKAAGLKVPHAKDRSVDCGPDGLGLGCSEVIATDTVTVYVFPDEISAGDIAETWGGQSYRRGAVVLNYLEAKTPAAERARYERVLNALR
ncbi:hypothetical protein JOD64_004330 [Micromonospora luteifusca]|uniref:Uncharacterized protein n=1 Tax=Micromonospora luteifusca TaxID=709860 RepID=A0ABS2LY35_9ACTN|nr:hypothetical protein [Micromonospora luteifusca]MBM7493108.1 hypothetical protein [Micromonospora luteifusca]